jgi:hypothetical protein
MSFFCNFSRIDLGEYYFYNERVVRSILYKKGRTSHCNSSLELVKKTLSLLCGLYVDD